MVETITINRVQSRDRLVVDCDVWMHDPNDFEFRPRLVLHDRTLAIMTPTEDEPLATIELDDDAMAFVERDRMAEFRTKLQVRGMHGELVHKHPILADGAANIKKLAEPRWKTTLPILVA